MSHITGIDDGLAVGLEVLVGSRYEGTSGRCWAVYILVSREEPRACVKWIRVYSWATESEPQR